MARPKGSKNQPKPSLPESEQPEPNEHAGQWMDMTLYVVNYWVPFPASEYGGMQVVIAKDDEQCYALISEADTHEMEFHKDAEELIRARIKKASRFTLDGAYLPEIVRSFRT
jgi:hypothetical protein